MDSTRSAEAGATQWQAHGPGLPSRAAQWLLFACTTLLYLATFPVRSDGELLGNDAIHYAADMAAGSCQGLAHPHHLLFHPLVALAALPAQLWREAPPTAINYLWAQQWISSIGGALFVLAVFRLAAQLAGTLRATALAACAIVAAGTWLYSAVGETYTPAAAALAWLLVEAVQTKLGLRPSNVLRSTLWLLLALLLRQDAILILPILPLLLGARTSIITIGAAGTLSVCLYSFGWALSGSEQAFVPWLRGLIDQGTWGHAPGLTSWSLAVGLTGAAWNYGLVELRPLFMRGDFASFGSLSAAALGSLALLAAALMPKAVLFRSTTGKAALALALFALTRLCFFAWWEPSNMEHHSTTLVPLFLLAALLLRTGPARAVPQALLLVGACALTAATNFHMIVRHNRGSLMHERVLEAEAKLGSGGWIVALDARAHYAARRAGVGSARLFDASSAIAAGGERQRALEGWLQSRLQAGERVVLLRDTLLPARFPWWPKETRAEQAAATLLSLGTPELLLNDSGQAWAVVLNP